VIHQQQGFRGRLQGRANANRRLIEEVLLRVRCLELGVRREPPTHADRGGTTLAASDTSASDRPE